MSTLSAFLKPVKTTIEKEVVISDRFVGDDGKPVPFKVRAISQEENDALVRAATKTRNEGGQRVERLDSVEYAQRLIVAATVSPDFRAKDICEAYGVVSPLMVPGKMLLSGEYNRLMKAITELSEFDESAQDEDVKN